MKKKKTSDYTYDAFISYRHLDPDMYVAEKLHRALETYKIPYSYRKKLPDDKRQVRRIFRDQEELPLASNLEEPIQEALCNSKYLIVICTPNLKYSEWCRNEIKTFLEHNDRSHIIVVLADGDPVEVVPQNLWPEDLNPGYELNTEGELNPGYELNPDDNLRTSDELGLQDLSRLYDVDVRSTSKWSYAQAVKESCPFLVSRILSLDHERLESSITKQKRFKIGLSMVPLVVFAIIIVVMLLSIIYTVLDQRDIYAKNMTRMNYVYTQLAQANFDDNRPKSIELASKVLFRNGDVGNSDARLILFNALNLYDCGDEMHERYCLQSDERISRIIICPDWGVLICYYDDYSYKGWDYLNNSILFEVPDVADEMIPAYITSDGRFIYSTVDGKVGIYDIANRKMHKASEKNNARYDENITGEVKRLFEIDEDISVEMDNYKLFIPQDSCCVHFLSKEVSSELTVYDGTLSKFDNLIMDSGNVPRETDQFLGTDAEGNKYYITGQNGYLTDVNGGTIGLIDHMIGFDDEEDKVFVQSNDGTIYWGKTYSLDELYEQIPKED